jgi:hypothetical protein
MAPAARHGRLDVKLDTVGYPEWLSWTLDVGGLEPVSTVRGVGGTGGGVMASLHESRRAIDGFAGDPSQGCPEAVR